MPLFYTRLVGVNFRPIEAQAAVSELEPGATVYIIRDPENEFDPNAIKVYDYEGPESRHHLGFIAAKSKDEIALASEIAEFMDLNTWYRATVMANAGTKSPLLLVEIYEDDEVA